VKVTVEIADAVLQEARNLAAARQTTLRQIVEEGLRAVTGTRQMRRFRLRDGSFGGNGTSVSHWSDVRQAIYEGRGE